MEIPLIITTLRPQITAAPTFPKNEVSRRDPPQDTCGFVKDDTAINFACESGNKCAALRTEYGSPLWAAPCAQQVSRTTYFPTACTTTCTDTACVNDFSLRKCISSPYTTCVLETWPALNVQYWDCWDRGTEAFLGHTPTITMELSADDATASPWRIYVATESFGSISSDILTTVSAPFTGISLMVAGSSNTNTQTSATPTSSTSNPSNSNSISVTTSTSTAPSSSSSSANTGSITGGVVGGVFVLAVLVFGFWWSIKFNNGQKGNASVSDNASTKDPTTDYWKLDSYEPSAGPYGDSSHQSPATSVITVVQDENKLPEDDSKGSDASCEDDATSHFTSEGCTVPMRGRHYAYQPVNPETD